MAFEIPLSSFPSPLPENELKRELNGFINEKKKINLSLSLREVRVPKMISFQPTYMYISIGQKEREIH